MRRSRSDIPPLFAAPWQSVFEEQVFKPRSRRRASFLDTIEPVVRFLAATGQLNTYVQPGVDPLGVIQAKVDARDTA